MMTIKTVVNKLSRNKSVYIEHEGNRLTSIQLMAILDYVHQKNYDFIEQIPDEVVDLVLCKLSAGEIKQPFKLFERVDQKYQIEITNSDLRELISLRDYIMDFRPNSVNTIAVIEKIISESENQISKNSSL